MILYHFTRPNNVESIKEYGIIRGDVPTSPTDGFNAPWLTDDPEPKNQTWIAIADKNKVRITVNIKNDKWLRKWSSFAATRELDPMLLEAIDKLGGGGSNHWYIYLGRIPAKWVIEVEHL